MRQADCSWRRCAGSRTVGEVTIEHVEGTDDSMDPRKIHTVVTHATAAAAREQEIQLSTQRVQQIVEVPQVQHHHINQVMQEKTGERERKGERGKKQEGREAEEERDKEIKKDVMCWTVVTRSKKQSKRAFQIFVKVDGMKTVLREVSPEDKVQKVLNTVIRTCKRRARERC